MKLTTVNYVFSVLARFAKHPIADVAITRFEKFAESGDSVYTFANTNGETYTLTVNTPDDIPVLGYPTNDYSGDPAVVETVNAYLTRVNFAPTN